MVTGASAAGSTRPNRTFSRTSQGASEESNSAPMAVVATRMNEAASSHPMRVMVTPNRPNSFVARVITSGM